MNQSECELEIDGKRIRCIRAGTGPPLLLLHGLLGGSFCWRFCLPVLAERNSVYAVDLPGLALSDDMETDCSMSCQAERLFRLIEQSNWNDLTIMGCSFGGAIAMLLAAADAHVSRRIRSLVMAAPVNPWSEFGRRRIRRFSTSLGGLFLRAALPISRPCHGIALRRMYGDPSRIPQDALAGYSASVLRPGRAQNILTALRSWQKDVDALRRIIPQIKIPALLVWGDRDQAVDPRSATVLQRHLPNSELKFIPGAGHLSFEEAPEEFIGAVLEFLHGSETGRDQNLTTENTDCTDFH